MAKRTWWKWYLSRAYLTFNQLFQAPFRGLPLGSCVTQVAFRKRKLPISWKLGCMLRYSFQSIQKLDILRYLYKSIYKQYIMRYVGDICHTPWFILGRSCKNSLPQKSLHLFGANGGVKTTDLVLNRQLCLRGMNHQGFATSKIEFHQIVMGYLWDIYGISMEY